MEKHHYLSAQVWQKGNKLGTYRNAKAEERFQAARFNMTLLRRAGAAQWERVKSGSHNGDFASSMIVDIEDVERVAAGEYVLVVEA